MSVTISVNAQLVATISGTLEPLGGQSVDLKYQSGTILSDIGTFTTGTITGSVTGIFSGNLGTPYNLFAYYQGGTIAGNIIQPAVGSLMGFMVFGTIVPTLILSAT